MTFFELLDDALKYLLLLSCACSITSIQLKWPDFPGDLVEGFQKFQIWQLLYDIGFSAVFMSC